MRATIMRIDNKVFIDGEALDVDCSLMSEHIHAVQWYGSYGEVEYSADSRGVVAPSLRITDFSPFQHYIDEHGRKKAAIAAAKEAEAAEEAVRQAKVQTKTPDGGLDVLAE